MKSKLDLFWIGKRPQLRGAVEEYLILSKKDKPFPSEVITKKHGISVQSIRRAIRMLYNDGLLEKEYDVIPWLIDSLGRIYVHPDRGGRPSKKS